jgi:TonB family protein
MSITKRLGLALIVLSLPALARGQAAGQLCDVERWGSTSQGRMWNQMFRQTYEELRKADPGTAKKSAKRARKLLDGLLDAFVSGPNGSRFIAYTNYLLAVAEQRLGRPDDAAWHWQMAQNFAPELRNAYDDFPDLVPFLRDNLLSAEHLGGGSKSGLGGPTTGLTPPGATNMDPEKMKRVVTPPVLIHKVKPTYPLGARELHVDGATVVQAYVDGEGIPRAPTVKQGCGVTVFDVAAMDAVRQWRYKPATLDGKPTPLWLTVTVSFSLIH